MISNIALTNAAQEYALLLPRGTRSYRLRLREAAAMRVAETEGATLASSYFTIASGTVLAVDDIDVIEAGGRTLWLRCPSQAATAEVFSW